jgi:hypothetical protein
MLMYVRIQVCVGLPQHHRVVDTGFEAHYLSMSNSTMRLLRRNTSSSWKPMSMGISIVSLNNWSFNLWTCTRHGV